MKIGFDCQVLKIDQRQLEEDEIAQRFGINDKFQAKFRHKDDIVYIYIRVTVLRKITGSKHIDSDFLDAGMSVYLDLCTIENRYNASICVLHRGRFVGLSSI